MQKQHGDWAEKTGAVQPGKEIAEHIAQIAGHHSTLPVSETDLTRKLERDSSLETLLM